MSELTNLVAKQNEESYQLGKKHGAIEELEKIKKEIRENVFCYDKEQIIRLIIDKHISELNGTYDNP